jgi:NAD(P)-dependent dehydrogenase (short-subunit alcohol dehydrogenase family)
MQSRQEGVIINIASFAGVQGLVQHGAYGAAKAGLIQLTKVLAVENFGRGVRANAVIMGSVATEGNEAARASIAEGAHGHDWVPGRSRGGPLAPARMQPVDAARAVAVLCSDDAREITGASIAVDRGYSAGWLAATLIQLGVGGLLPDTD